MIVGWAAELAYSPIFFSKSQQEVDFFNCRDLLPPPFICYISLSSTYCVNSHRVPLFTSDFPNIPEYDYGTSLHHDMYLLSPPMKLLVIRQIIGRIITQTMRLPLGWGKTILAPVTLRTEIHVCDFLRGKVYFGSYGLNPVLK